MCVVVLTYDRSLNLTGKKLLESICPAQQGFNGFALTLLNDRQILLTGGRREYYMTNQACVMDLETGLWTKEVPQLLINRCNHAS